MVTDHKLSVFENIGKLSADGVFIYHLTEQRFQFLNPAFSGIFEIAEEILFENAADLVNKIAPDDIDFLYTKYSELMEHSRISDVEFRVVVNNGIEKYLKFDGYLLTEDGVIVGFVKDISKQKEYENYVINYGSKKDTMLEMLSHNLSGPLTLVQRMLNIVDKAYRQQKFQDVSSHIQFIGNATQHCVDIIHDFLKEEHFVSEHIYVKQNRFDIIDKVRDVIDEFKESYRGNELHFSTDKNQLFVTGDDIKILQVLNNLLSNALKFTPANCRVEVRIEEADDNYMIIVKDDGIGIPEHLQPLIFQKQTPAGRVGLNGEKSLGFGLSIVKKLVSLMKGEIRFESKQDRGTTFYVTLPKT